jgi:hypothetical protein
LSICSTNKRNSLVSMTSRSPANHATASAYIMSKQSLADTNKIFDVVFSEEL